MFVSLGEIYSGVFTNSKKLWKKLLNAGKTTNDPFWRMPLNDGYIKSLKKSTVADLVNVGDRGGGSCIAAIFLKEFVCGLTSTAEDDENNEKGDTSNNNNSAEKFNVDKELGDADEEKKIRYAHIDMAGSMITSQDSGYDVKGMTGIELTLTIIIATSNLKT